MNKSDPITLLESGVYAALETYSNVHRGSGHNSQVTTHLYEQAREIVLNYLGLDKRKYIVIFCTPHRAALLGPQIVSGRFQTISSADIGLSLGVAALAAEKKSLPRGIPFQTGGGSTRLISRDWVVWASAPDRFEAGTPAIINIIAFARSLNIIKMHGKNAFRKISEENITAADILYHDELIEFSGQELLEKLRLNIIGRNLPVPTVEGIKPYINLDNAASTPAFREVWRAVCRSWNLPAGVKMDIITEVRSICALMLGAPKESYEMIFTSNTTEAINLTAENLRHESHDKEDVVLNTLLEHTSNELPWRMIPGCELIHIPIDKDGIFDLNQLESVLSEYNQNNQHGDKRIRIVTVSGASNVLGICNNLSEISKIIHQYGALMLVDAAQLVSHRKINMEECIIDFLAFSAHKAYAPFGTGVLIARKGLLNFSPSELEKIKSSGEENIIGIAALGKALVLLQRVGLEIIREEEKKLTSKALTGLSKIEGITLYGISEVESRNFDQKIGVIVFTMKGLFANSVATELAGHGIGVRYGCHCAHMLVKKLLKLSPGLEKFQRVIVTLFTGMRLPGVTRVSLGIENTEEDIDELLRVLTKIARKELIKSRAKQPMNEFTELVSRRVYSNSISD
jgi:selenocysteine lyase/cysteine desulfurase